MPKGETGLLVTSLYRNGPAHRAGMQPGDVLLSIDGKKTADSREVLMQISSHKPGDKIRVEVLREGKKIVLEALAGERPQAQRR